MSPWRSNPLGHIPLAAVVLFLSSRGAAAEQPAPDMQFVWNRSAEAADCPETEAIQADVTTRLGWNPFSTDAKSVLECQVTRENGTWSATIEERDETGARAGYRVVTSTAATCESLGAAVGLAIALIVRNRASSVPAPPPPTPPPPPPAPPLAPKCPDVPCRRDFRIAWHAAAVGAVRVLPETALGASLAGRMSPNKSLSIAVDLSLLPPIRTESSLGDFAFSGAWGAAGACYDVEFGSDVAMSTCVSATLGALHVAVYDPIPVEPGARLFAGLVAGPELRFSPAAPFDVVFGVSAFVPIKRSSFLVETVSGTETLFTQPAVGALFKLGAGFGG